MSLIAKMFLFLNGFFRTVAKASRPAWEFRIRLSLEKRCWVIELHENGDQQWRPLTRLDETTDGELHVYKFDSYQDAHQYVLTTGLHLAYEQAHFTHNQQPLHHSANTVENAILEASLGSMGSSFNRDAVLHSLHPVSGGTTWDRTRTTVGAPKRHVASRN